MAFYILSDIGMALTPYATRERAVRSVQRRNLVVADNWRIVETATAAAAWELLVADKPTWPRQLPAA